MLGSAGDSHRCIGFRDYDSFLQAYLKADQGALWSSRVSTEVAGLIVDPSGKDHSCRPERGAPMHWIYLLIAIFAEVVGTSALKASVGMTKLGPTAVVVVGYGAAFYLLSLTLDQIPVGVAYAIWSGVGIVAISLIGWRFSIRRWTRRRWWEWA